MLRENKWIDYIIIIISLLVNDKYYKKPLLYKGAVLPACTTMYIWNNYNFEYTRQLNNRIKLYNMRAIQTGELYN